MHHEKKRSLELQELEDGEVLFKQYTQGDLQVLPTLRQRLKEHIGKWVAGSLAQIQDSLRMGIKRLCFDLFGEMFEKKVRNLQKESGYLGLLLQFLQEVCEEILSRLGSPPQRDPEKELARSIRERLSFSIEGQLIDRLTLREPLKRLYATNREWFELVHLKYMLGYSYEEISAARDLSVQNIRTSLKHATTFLRGQV